MRRNYLLAMEVINKTGLLGQNFMQKTVYGAGKEDVC